MPKKMGSSPITYPCETLLHCYSIRGERLTKKGPEHNVREHRLHQERLKQKLKDLVAAILSNANVLEEKSNSSKHEIVQVWVESFARLNSVILTNVRELYMSDTLERRHFTVSKMKAIFEINRTGYPLHDIE